MMNWLDVRVCVSTNENIVFRKLMEECEICQGSTADRGSPLGVGPKSHDCCDLCWAGLAANTETRSPRFKNGVLYWHGMENIAIYSIHCLIDWPIWSSGR